MNTLTTINIGVQPAFIREYCFLQLRMTCELIALGCLVAHGDIKGAHARSLQKSYKADEILKRLGELHPEFYPIPVKPIFGEGSVRLDNVDFDFMSKPDLITLYGRCGDVLHKGTLRKLMSPNKVDHTNLKDVNIFGQKILNLLSSHRISRIGGDFHFLTFLQVPRLNGAAQVAIAESPKEDNDDLP